VRIIKFYSMNFLKIFVLLGILSVPHNALAFWFTLEERSPFPNRVLVGGSAGSEYRVSCGGNITCLAGIHNIRM